MRMGHLYQVDLNQGMLLTYYLSEWLAENHLADLYKRLPTNWIIPRVWRKYQDNDKRALWLKKPKKPRPVPYSSKKKEYSLPMEGNMTIICLLRGTGLHLIKAESLYCWKGRMAVSCILTILVLDYKCCNICYISSH